MAGLPQYLGLLHFDQWPFLDSLHGIMTPSVLGLQLLLRLHLCSLLASQSAKYQHLSVTTPSCLQNHLETNTHDQYQLPTQGTTMATSETQTMCVGRKEILLKRSYSMILFSLSPLISHPQLSSINCPSNTKVSLVSC